MLVKITNEKRPQAIGKNQCTPVLPVWNPVLIIHPQRQRLCRFALWEERGGLLVVQEEECDWCWKVQAGEEQEVSVYFSHFLSEALRVQCVRAPLTVTGLTDTHKHANISLCISPFPTYPSLHKANRFSFFDSRDSEKPVSEILQTLNLCISPPGFSLSTSKLQNRPSCPHHGSARQPSST